LHGVIAPRPLLVEIGSYDECFKVDSAMSCFKEVEKIYAAAGARDCLVLDLFEGGHKWGGNKSVAFFREHLGGGVVGGTEAFDRRGNAGGRERMVVINRDMLRASLNSAGSSGSGAAKGAAGYAVGGGGAGGGGASPGHGGSGEDVDPTGGHGSAT
jgi:hypothetical protein